MNELDKSEKYEALLNDPNKKFPEKVTSLLQTWEFITNILQIKTISQEEYKAKIEWAVAHTLRLVLRGEWNKAEKLEKDHLGVTLQRCVALLKDDQLSSSRCKTLQDIVKNPWNNPILVKIIKNEKVDDLAEEEFCCTEKGELLTMRLRVLSEDRCEDIAVNLAAACIRSLQRSDRFRSLSDPSQIEYMIDIYIVLLYKLKRTKDMMDQMKLMDLKEGLELVQRLSGERPTKYGTAKVWRNSSKAAVIVAQYLVATGMVKPLSEVTVITLERILNSWALLHSKDESKNDLSGIIRKIIEPAESAQHIYIFCRVLVKYFGETMKPLVIELYIRALTADMNELENQKAKSNKDKVRETEQRLSEEILNLADFVADHVVIVQECLLTAFSLNPSRTCYERIKDLAQISCKNENPSIEMPLSTSSTSTTVISIKNELPNKEIKNNTDSIESVEISKENLIIKEETENSKVKTEVKIEVDETVSTEKPTHLLDAEKLGLPPQLCQDLDALLTSQRYQVLKWDLTWPELSSLCQNYLDNTEQMRNHNKELKYLNIDYSQFKDQSNEDNDYDEYIGIEKGYEKWAENSSDDDYYSLAKRSDDDSDIEVYFNKRNKRNLKKYSSDSEHEYSKTQKRRNRQNKKLHFRPSVSSDSDGGNIQKEAKLKKPKKPRVSRKIPKHSNSNKLSSETVSQIHLLLSDNARQDANVDSNEDIITLFSADPDENNKHEIIRASDYSATPFVIKTEKKSDPQVLKSLRMFRKHDFKNKILNTEIKTENMPNENSNVNNKSSCSNDVKVEPLPRKNFAPPLSNINMNPKIVLMRADEADRKLIEVQNKNKVSPKDLNAELRKIQKNFNTKNNGSINIASPEKIKKGLIKKTDLPDILANTLDFAIAPRICPTVNVVQLTRNGVPKSPNSANSISSNSTSNTNSNTPPRGRSAPQIPGTPISGHSRDSEATQASDSVANEPTQEVPRTMRVAVLSNHISSTQSPEKINSSNGPSEHVQIVGYPAATGQRIITLQNQQTNPKNTGLPKFQQAFGKNTMCLSTDSPGTTTVATSSNATTSVVPDCEKSTTNNNPTDNSTNENNNNLSKSVQTTTPATNATAKTANQSNSNQSNSDNNSNNNNNNQPSGPETIPASSSIPLTLQTQRHILNLMQSALSGTPGSLMKLPPGVKLKIVPAVRGNTMYLTTTSTPRLNQQQQQQQQQQSNVRSETITNSSTDGPNQTTLDQIREFESVLEQVKERSTNHQSTSTETSKVQTQTVQNSPEKPQQVTMSALERQLLMPTQTSSSDFQFSAQQNSSLSQKVTLAYVNQNNGTANNKKIVNTSPVVVVTSYCQPAASPALSVTSHSSSSPCVTPAPTPVPSSSANKTQGQSKSKKNTSKSVKTTSTTTANNTASKTSPIPKPQQKPQEDEQTTQRIYQILTQYAEQLRNSPDLNNKPAPRRRSNPPSNPGHSSKRRKSGSGKSKSGNQGSDEPSPSSEDPNRTMGSSEDSSGATSSLMNVQDSPAGFSASEDTYQGSSANSDAMLESRVIEAAEEITNSKKKSPSTSITNNQQQPQQQSQQHRTLIVQEAIPTSRASESLKVTPGAATVFVSGTNLMLPMNLVKSGQHITVVSGGSKLLAAVPAIRGSGGASIPNTLVLQSLLTQANKIAAQGQTGTTLKQVKIPALQSLNSAQGTTTAVVIPHTGSVLRFTDDSNKTNESAKPTETAIILNSNPNIGLFQRTAQTGENSSIDSSTQQQNFSVQGATRIFSSIAGGKTNSVVCLVPENKKNSSLNNNNTSSSGSGGHLANALLGIHSSNKEVIKTETINTCSDTKNFLGINKSNIIHKKKIDGGRRDINATVINTNFRSDFQGDKTGFTPIKQEDNKQSILTSSLTQTNSAVVSLDSGSQYLIKSELNNSDIQEPHAVSLDGLDNPCKIENGVLVSNARLQEAWGELERKSSPDSSRYTEQDTPWRFTGTTPSSLITEPPSIISNKPHDLNSNTNYIKKYYINHSVDSSYSKLQSRGIIKNSVQPCQRSESDIIQNQRKAALERELRLQKSLSEECEDLGVDELSTKDLFPEADLPFDTNHSPAFDNSSQEASCSQNLSNVKYASSIFNFSKLDSSSGGSRDGSPLSLKDTKVNENKKAIIQKQNTKCKDNLKRPKKTTDNLHSQVSLKQMKVVIENFSQDEISNSTSDLSSSEIELFKDTTSKEIIEKSYMKINEDDEKSKVTRLDLNIESESILHSSIHSNSNDPTKIINENVDSILDSSAVNADEVTVPCPLIPIPGPLSTSQKFNTYSNNRKRLVNRPVRTADYMNWESSPASENTLSSSGNEFEENDDDMDDQDFEGDDDEEDDEDDEIDDDEDDLSSTEDMELNILSSNGLQGHLKNLPSIKSNLVDHATYVNKRKISYSLNKSDSKNSLATNKKLKIDLESYNEGSLQASGSDKTFEGSDEELSNNAIINQSSDCRTRTRTNRNSKKSCSCCNGPPEKSKPKKTLSSTGNILKIDNNVKVRKKSFSSKNLSKKR